MNQGAQRRTQDTYTTLEIPVYGMGCQSCAGSLELAIGALPNVQSVKADAEACAATIVATERSWTVVH